MTHDDENQAANMLSSAQIAYNAEHEQVFRQRVLDRHGADLDETTRTQVLNMPLLLLADLYQNLWLYGPRGDVYIRQLGVIEMILTKIAAGTWTDEFVIQMEAAGESWFAAVNKLTQKVSTTARIEHYPSTKLPFLSDNEDEDEDDDKLAALVNPADTVINHQAWVEKLDNEEYDSAFIIELFTFMSLFLPFLDDLSGEDQDEFALAALLDYDAICSNWGIPR